MGNHGPRGFAGDRLQAPGTFLETGLFELLFDFIGLGEECGFNEGGLARKPGMERHPAHSQRFAGSSVVTPHRPWMKTAVRLGRRSVFRKLSEPGKAPSFPMGTRCTPGFGRQHASCLS